MLPKEPGRLPKESQKPMHRDNTSGEYDKGFANNKETSLMHADQIAASDDRVVWSHATL